MYRVKYCIIYGAVYAVTFPYYVAKEWIKN